MEDKNPKFHHVNHYHYGILDLPFHIVSSLIVNFDLRALLYSQVVSSSSKLIVLILVIIIIIIILVIIIIILVILIRMARSTFQLVSSFPNCVYIVAGLLHNNRRHRHHHHAHDHLYFPGDLKTGGSRFKTRGPLKPKSSSS